MERGVGHRDSKALGGVELEQLAEVEQCQLHIILGLRSSELALCQRGLLL